MCWTFKCRNYETNKAGVSQSRFLLTPVTSNETDTNSYTWWVPLSMTTPAMGFDKTSPDTWLDPANAGTETEVDLSFVSSTEPVIVNVQQTGFYRVNYDSKNWELISSALLNNFEDIHRYDFEEAIWLFHNFLQNQQSTNSWWCIESWKRWFPWLSHGSESDRIPDKGDQLHSLASSYHWFPLPGEHDEAYCRLWRSEKLSLGYPATIIWQTWLPRNRRRNIFGWKAQNYYASGTFQNFKTMQSILHIVGSLSTWTWGV